MNPVSSGISRRETFRMIGAAAASAAASAALLPAAASAQTADAPQLKRRVRQSAVRGLLGKGGSAEDYCRTALSLGLVGVDFTGPGDWPVLKDHGLEATLVSGAGGIKDGLNNTSKHADFLKLFQTNISAAAKFGWKTVITMAGDRAGISDADGMAACVPVLKEAVKIAADNGVTICMELLNSKIDHAGYMCDHTAWGVELCKRIDSPHFKLLYDIYHMQIMEGDVIRTITDNIDHIGHFHTAGVPGRKDLDDEQELFYPAVMRAIAKLVEAGKYTGVVAHEFSTKHGIESLRKAVQLCDV
ncbi:MAG: TIM barrel protein [Verrucomicrobiota bacterium]|jgi:hydroxypyruvate isomerase|nr:TIM barrel protein [Verrucomicrobiota bacterium]